MREGTSEGCVPRFLRSEEEVRDEGRKKEREKERFEKRKPARSLSPFTRSRGRRSQPRDRQLLVFWSKNTSATDAARHRGPPPRAIRAPRSTMRKAGGRLLPQFRQSVRLVEFNLDYISRGISSSVGSRSRVALASANDGDQDTSKRANERHESRSCSLASRLRTHFERRDQRDHSRNEREILAHIPCLDDCPGCLNLISRMKVPLELQ